MLGVLRTHHTHATHTMPIAAQDDATVFAHFLGGGTYFHWEREGELGD